MIKRYLRNDFKLNITPKVNGVFVDLSTMDSVVVSVCNKRTGERFEPIWEFTPVGIELEITRENTKATGVYFVDISYRKPDVAYTDNYQDRAQEQAAFEIVPMSEAIDEADDSITIEMIEIMRGYPFTYDDFTPEQLDWLRKPASDAALEVEAVITDVDQAEGIRISNETERLTQETERQTAETVRIDNEDERKTNESSRLSAENTRVNSENSRISSEGSRITTETERVSSETARVTAEGLRVSAESNRVNAETVRISSENDRVSAENIRVDSEEDRVTAENVRVSAETSRGNAETVRVNSESGRVSAETARVSAEANRVTAETTRATAESGRITAEATRLSTENARLSAETARVTAESGRVSAESSRVTAETSRATAETARANAELVRIANEEARILNAESWENIDEKMYKPINIGTSGLITFKPKPRNKKYKLTVLNNVQVAIDLSEFTSRGLECDVDLIIEMPIVKTITMHKPITWNNNTADVLNQAGQYTLRVTDAGNGLPLLTVASKTTKAVNTGTVLYVDSAGATYTDSDITTADAGKTRANSTWATAFRYLQNAINQASAGDTILMKQGTYKPTHIRSVGTYTAGDSLNRQVSFTLKNGVDIYGGFAGTETKVWERQNDVKGFPILETILSGDLRNEAVIDPATTVGDRRTEASKANACHAVVYANVGSYTYLNGVSVKYGMGLDNAGAETQWNVGGGVNSTNSILVLTNVKVSDNTARNGGGVYRGTNTNCTIYSNSANSQGGGVNRGTNTNCTIYSNSATNGGGVMYGSNINCAIYSNSSTNYSGGAHDSTNTNCTIYSNSAINGGGGISLGNNSNCVLIGNVAPSASWATAFKGVNLLLLNNYNGSGNLVGFSLIDTAQLVIFKNNATDTSQPNITSSHPNSDINQASCLYGITLAQAGIEIPSFYGLPTNEAQMNELHEFAKNIKTKLKPAVSSILKNKGIGTIQADVSATDFNGDARGLNTCTIGAIE